MKQSEIITAVVVVASIVMWAFTPTASIYSSPQFRRRHGRAHAIFGLAGIIKDQDMGTGVSWTLLLFIGGVFSLQTVVQAVKITDWLGGYFIPVALQMSSNTFLLIAVMSVLP